MSLFFPVLWASSAASSATTGLGYTTSLPAALLRGDLAHHSFIHCDSMVACWSPWICSFDRYTNPGSSSARCSSSSILEAQKPYFCWHVDPGRAEEDALQTDQVYEALYALYDPAGLLHRLEITMHWNWWPSLASHPRRSSTLDPAAWSSQCTNAWTTSSSCCPSLSGCAKWRCGLLPIAGRASTSYLLSWESDRALEASSSSSAQKPKQTKPRPTRLGWQFAHSLWRAGSRHHDGQAPVAHNVHPAQQSWTCTSATCPPHGLSGAPHACWDWGPLPTTASSQGAWTWWHPIDIVSTRSCGHCTVAACTDLQVLPEWDWAIPTQRRIPVHDLQAQRFP